MSNKRQLSSRLTYAAETPKFLRGLVDSLPNARSTLPITLLGHIPDTRDDDEPTPYIGKEAKMPKDKEEKDAELVDEWNGPEEERPQIVVLRKGKHLSEEAVERELGLNQKETTTTKKKRNATDQHDDNHSSDDNEARGKTISEDGRLLFRSPKKTKRMTSKKSDADESKKRKKARKIQKASSKLLSFQTDDA
jgi:hypothetical protein